MADTSNPYFSTPLPNLSQEQRNLLRRALSSNKQISQPTSNMGQRLNPTMPAQSITDPLQSLPTGIDPSVLENFTNAGAPSDARQPTFGDGLFPGIDMSGGNLDMDRADFEEAWASALPELPLEGYEDGEYEYGEKRKSPSDEEDWDENGEQGQGDPKRREGEEKSAKKPGRKPITSEPTTKRKAQNRAAQRAFRERKEQHLKDLESKVEEFQKASDAANHENGLLKAQVIRLQAELREYRRRLSAASNGSSPTYRSSFSSGPNFGNSASKSTGFQFDFASFGSLPAGNFPSSTSYAGSNDGSAGQKSPPTVNGITQSPAHDAMPSAPVARTESQSSVNTKTPGSTRGNSMSAQTRSSTGSSSFFGSSFLDTADVNNYGWPTSTSPPTAQTSDSSRSNTGFFTNTLLGLDGLNGNTPSNTGSPSASSTSQNLGPSSSCGTSPEPSHNHNSPPAKKTDSLNLPTDNLNDLTNFASPAASDMSTNNVNLDFTGVNWLASQNGGQFDPVLFGGYRDSQNAIVGTSEFTGGLWDDFNLTEFDNPTNTIATDGFSFNLATDSTVPAPAPAAKQNLMQQVEAQREGDYSGGMQPETVKFSGAEAKAMYTCHAVWNKLQNCPKFASGDLDIDGLCKELSTKAKCSETGQGVQFPRDDVEAAIKRLVGDEHYDTHEAQLAQSALTEAKF